MNNPRLSRGLKLVYVSLIENEGVDNTARLGESNPKLVYYLPNFDAQISQQATYMCKKEHRAILEPNQKLGGKR